MPTTPRPALYDHLNALLQTMRLIELHEPQLCTLLHELKTTHKITPRLRKDLTAILDTLPHHTYVDDLEAVQHDLTEQTPR